MVAHDAILKGALSAKNASAYRPTILEMKDQHFIKKLLNALDKDGGRSLGGHLAPGKRMGQATTGSRSKDTSSKEKALSYVRPQAMQLFQPIHRVFHPIVVEACCNQPGEPRLNPDRIVASGIVVRKVEKDNTLKGWVTSNGTVLGWKSVTWGLGAGFGEDPDPEIRKKTRLGANKTLLEKLEEQGAVNAGHMYHETFASLFKVDPETCKKHKKTYLYGMAPLTSSERPEKDPDLDQNNENTGDAKPFQKSDIKSMVPALLQSGNTTYKKLPASYMRYGSPTNKTDAGRIAFMALVEFFHARCGLFTDEAYAGDLKKSLEKTTVRVKQKQGTTWVPKNINFFKFLEEAAALLMENRSEKGVDRIYMPEKWPEIYDVKKVGKNSTSKGPVVDEKALLAGIDKTFSGRWKQMGQVEAQYDDDSAQYVIACFIRVKGENGCPPKTVWTAPSEPFTIAPWYASSGCPPIQVALPPIDPDKPELMAGLAPGVAFKVPEKLQQIMEKMDIDSLMDGKKEKGTLGIGMICSFSIPIITLCAFIVLQIFLKLLNIVFWWLPFIKICIPYPKPSGESKWP